MANGTGYTFLRWNGKYGRDAKFVVRDNASGKQSLFTPGCMHDITWVTTDLANTQETKDWETFGDETVDNLEEVAF